ncbi:MAG: hypothetical protein DHS20C11_27570 [Lysobacteraceae bacterium]|nr:MAG: hypothetical protein DHS20C11_27570 [Xanthomonadaceae bacterium]
MLLNTRCARAAEALITGCVLLCLSPLGSAQQKYANSALTTNSAKSVTAPAPLGTESPLTHADLISFMRDDHRFAPLPAAANPESDEPALALNGKEAFPPVENRLALRWRANDLGNRAVASYNDAGRKVRKGMFGEKLADKIDLKLSSHPELNFKVDFD